ncbi:MAG: hypothetical protein A3E87_09695 [Gammaproteobacteria bacterium RIFCSPHIGHO2_12_FULL_35_23]|nr:MAG: hypothetical protein A3E87_09695 [Gammaproteobacteria bacterium RIFCSPHIGHO2_12_FULL_35_23]
MPAIDLANPLLVKILLQDDKHLLAFQLFLDKHLVAYIANYKGVTYLTPVVPEILEGRHIAGSPVLDFTQEEFFVVEGSSCCGPFYAATVQFSERSVRARGWVDEPRLIKVSEIIFTIEQLRAALLTTIDYQPSLRQLGVLLKDITAWPRQNIETLTRLLQESEGLVNIINRIIASTRLYTGSFGEALTLFKAIKNLIGDISGELAQVVLGLLRGCDNSYHFAAYAVALGINESLITANMMDAGEVKRDPVEAFPTHSAALGKVFDSREATLYMKVFDTTQYEVFKAVLRTARVEIIFLPDKPAEPSCWSRWTCGLFGAPEVGSTVPLLAGSKGVPKYT